MYLTYVIYDAQHPPDQIPPDPSKKTLVILGKFILPFQGFIEIEADEADNFQGLDGDLFLC